VNDQQQVAAPPVRQDAFVPGRISFAAAPTQLATDALNRLVVRYGDCPLAQATVVVPLGGDGFMLETVHRVLERHIPGIGKTAFMSETAAILAGIPGADVGVNFVVRRGKIELGPSPERIFGEEEALLDCGRGKVGRGRSILGIRAIATK